MQEQTATAVQQHNTADDQPARSTSARDLAGLLRLFDRLPRRDRLELVLLARMKVQLSALELEDDPASDSIHD